MRPNISLVDDNGDVALTDFSIKTSLGRHKNKKLAENAPAGAQSAFHHGRHTLSKELIRVVGLHGGLSG